MTVTGNRPCSV